MTFIIFLSSPFATILSSKTNKSAYSERAYATFFRFISLEITVIIQVSPSIKKIISFIYVFLFFQNNIYSVNSCKIQCLELYRIHDELHTVPSDPVTDRPAPTSSSFIYCALHKSIYIDIESVI
jgi:hypothetical protein